MNKPNFFIVGAAKAGTTSLYHYLNQHPDVYMSPIKEPHYFCKDIRRKDFNPIHFKYSNFDIGNYLKKPILEKKHIAFIEYEKDYLQLFRDVKNEKLVGEVSNGYLYSQVAAKEIYNFNPDAKIVMVLRNPVERAFSHWMMDLRVGDVCRSSFLAAVEKDLANNDKGWGKSYLYVELGLYYEQVKRYHDIFPKNHVLILLYDDLKNNPEAFFNELFTFIEIKPIGVDISKRHNESSIPRYPIFNKIIRKTQLIQLVKKFLPKEIKKSIARHLSKSDDLPVLTAHDKEQMKPYFKNNVEKLEKLIGKNLSEWQL